MRIQKLGLVKYGKFTDKELEFPRGENDFHVVVGPNEAGKSTVRSAITEMLYGMPHSSAMAFLHPLADLCISATIQGDGWERSFQRVRGRTPIRDAAGAAQPETYLEPLLEGVSKPAFLQMFSLDHARLVDGGKSILDPNESIGQLLFQAAAGIDSFGKVRDSYAVQASEQWVNRKGSGEYGKAQKMLEEANAELKRVQVRSAAWREASQQAEEAAQAVRDEEDQRTQLEALRIKLERFRRLAPTYATLEQNEQELEKQGETLPFPSTARIELEALMSKLSPAEALVEMRASDLERFEDELKSVAVDESVLDASEDIQELNALRNQCRTYARDILLREAEVNQKLELVFQAGAELGWGMDEAVIRTYLPGQLALSAVSRLLADKGRIEEARNAAAAIKLEKETEVENVAAKLSALPETSVPLRLRQALTPAQTFKANGVKQKQLAIAVESAQRELGRAVIALNRTDLTLEALRAMQVPSEERIASLRLERQEKTSAETAARTRLDEARATASRLDLRVSQYARGRTLATASQVADAREQRDSVWTSIKKEQLRLADGAHQLDSAIKAADELVDLQLLSTAEAAELQALKDQRDATKQDEERMAAAHEAAVKEVGDFERHWNTLAEGFGLAGLHLDDASVWLKRRTTALAHEDLVAQKTQEQATEKRECDHAAAELRSALLDAGIPAPPELDINILSDLAEEHVKTIERVRTQREAFQRQLDDAHAAVTKAEQELTRRTGDLEAWETSWEEAVRKAKLEGAASTAAEADAAVARAMQVASWLGEIDAIRRERIEGMRADLASLAKLANRVVQTAAPDLLVIRDPSDIASKLEARLKEAVQQKSKLQLAGKSLEAAKEKHSNSVAALRLLQASLKPLLDIAQVEDADAALPLIEAAERKSRLHQDIKIARDSLLKAGDGLTLESLRAELKERSVEAAAQELRAVQQKLDAIGGRLTSLLERKVETDRKLAAINGGADAATAEGKRQEALAAMGDAGELYVRFAASNLLMRWAVDRYRDRKQGPMLKRASAVFKTLTQGSFDRLDIDFYQKPPVLFAQRPDKQVVPVAGLSDGARDQLFLALRIAALELQMEQGAPFPFVADDLFINFDNDRSKAGLRALFDISKRTQVIFLSHHEHLVPEIEKLFGQKANVITLEGIPATA